jgi:hypothetical protein
MQVLLRLSSSSIIYEAYEAALHFRFFLREKYLQQYDEKNCGIHVIIGEQSSK